MEFKFEHREIKTIEESVRKHREEIWKNLPIPKHKPLEWIKEVRKEFESITNPFLEEGRCNNVLKKIQDYDEMLIREFNKKVNKNEKGSR